MARLVIVASSGRMDATPLGGLTLEDGSRFFVVALPTPATVTSIETFDASDGRIESIPVP